MIEESLKTIFYDLNSCLKLSVASFAIKLKFNLFSLGFEISHCISNLFPLFRNTTVHPLLAGDLPVS